MARGGTDSRVHGQQRARAGPCAQALTLPLLVLPLQNILFVFTSHDQFLSGKPTGWYLCVPGLALKCSALAAAARSPRPALLTLSPPRSPEAAHPYYILKEAGYTIDFASPKVRPLSDSLLAHAARN